jgi:hypothetical protein
MVYGFSKCSKISNAVKQYRLRFVAQFGYCLNPPLFLPYTIFFHNFENGLGTPKSNIVSVVETCVFKNASVFEPLETFFVHSSSWERISFVLIIDKVQMYKDIFLKQILILIISIQKLEYLA